MHGSSWYIIKVTKFSIIWRGSWSWNWTLPLTHFSPPILTNSLSNGLRYQRAITALPDAPSMTLTFLAQQFLMEFVAKIYVIVLLVYSTVSLSRPMSSILQFLLIVFQFCWHWGISRTSFLHLLQNPIDIFYTIP